MRIETDRLILRLWRVEDLEPFAQMSADPEVMQWLGGVLTREQVQTYMERANDAFARLGMCRMAIERKSDGAFLGVTGLAPSHEALADRLPPFTDMSWCLRQEAWGRGYMTEAVRAVAADGFGRLALTEITAMVSSINLRSRAVMTRLGMTHDEAVRSFIGLGYEADDPRGPTLVYRLTA